MAGENRLKKVLLEKPWLITLGLAGVLVLVIALALVGIGLIQRDNNEIQIIEAEPMAPSEVEGESKGTILVDVGGAVIRPGIYQLPPDSRVNDALIVSGGLSKEADRDWISQNVNLAAKLTDGAKIYLPFQDSNKDSPSQSKGLSLEDTVNINTASLSELDTLWGIGPVTGQKIIDSRPYGKIEDLLDKKIVKSNVYEAIKDKITVL